MSADKSTPIDIRIGLLARADNTGLGVQTWEFYKNIECHKVMVIDLTRVNQSMGKKTQLHLERYPNAKVIPGFPTNPDIDEFLKDLDLVFTIETPYSYYLFKRARELGIKTVLNYNYEFLDYLQHPEWELPDMLLAPSQWNLREVIQEFGKRTQVKYLPVPINRDVLPYKKRTKAKTFIHIAGHPTHEDRNGTQLLIKALPYIKNKYIKIIIHSQYEIPNKQYNPIVEYNNNETKHYWDNFRTGDVLILPRKYGGLSLQLNEAIATGMIPLMPYIPPQDGFLPREVLMPTHRAFRIQTRTSIDCFEVNPQTLAEYIDKLADMDEKGIGELSEFAGHLGMQWGWHTMKKRYMDTFRKLCK